MKKIFFENLKTLIYALLIAIIIRSFLFQPFYIPSSSMEPNLLIGDRLFVSKYSYGYSRHSLPFSPNIFEKRIFEKIPKRGDIIVFKTPADNRTDYIKRLVGLPGDKIQIKNGDLFLNDLIVNKEYLETTKDINCGKQIIKTKTFMETLPNGVSYKVVYSSEGTMLNTDPYIVPNKHYFFMGDNRDCSKDSRFLSSVGYVNSKNLVGRAEIIFFSNDKNEGSFFKFWKWGKSLRFNRILKKIK